MREPMSWSFSIGRVFGITVKVHILLVLVMLGLYLRVAYGKDYYPGTHIEVLAILGILFISILLHEFGHCYGARLMDGEASEIMLWPLGGLAFVDVPHTPRANFVAAAMGPAVNVALCAVAGGALAFSSLVPPFNPAWYIFDAQLYNYAEGGYYANGRYKHNAIDTTRTETPRTPAAVAAAPAGEANSDAIIGHLQWWQLLAARVFYLNWLLTLLNVLVLAYPLDGGRMLQAALWPHLGYRRATLTAVYTGFVFLMVIIIYAIATNEVLALCLAVFIYQACRQQWFILETGGEESLFGYDFSQGYTSLEREDEAKPPRKRQPNFLQRWLQRRAARKLQQEKARQEAEEHRTDELLQKIQREGKDALTDEEHRFLKRVSDRYKNRK